MPYYAAPFTFNFSTNRILVDTGVTDVDCIALYAAIKAAQSSEEGIIYERVGKGSGLSVLGPGVQVGLTVELLGAWQLQFGAGNYIARVAGGNLIGGPGGDPIAYSAGVQTLLIQSAASTVVQGGGGGSGTTTAFAGQALVDIEEIRDIAIDAATYSGVLNAMTEYDVNNLPRFNARALHYATGGGGGSSGTGSIVCRVEAKDANTLAPVAGAMVTVSKAGAMVAYQRTNNSGIAEFALDAGAHSYAIAASGYIQEFGTFTPVQNGVTTVNMQRASVVPPAPFVGLCNVLFAITHVGNPVQNARVTAELQDQNPTVDNYLLSKQVVAGVTDANGECILTLVQRAQFTRGGKYRIRAVDQQGRVLHDRIVTILNSPTANAEDLPDA